MYILHGRNGRDWTKLETEYFEGGYNIPNILAKHNKSRFS